MNIILCFYVNFVCFKSKPIISKIDFDVESNGLTVNLLVDSLDSI